MISIFNLRILTEFELMSRGAMLMLGAKKLNNEYNEKIFINILEKIKNGEKINNIEKWMRETYREENNKITKDQKLLKSIYGDLPME